MAIKVFLDSDVVISSLLSSSGAAHLLFEDAKVKFIISDLSVAELKIVAIRLGIQLNRLTNLIRTRCRIIELKTNSKELDTLYQGYVLHAQDAHIVSGAKQAKVDFIISYNTKHFQTNKIKQDFDITIVTPGQFLQYLRSLN